MFQIKKLKSRYRFIELLDPNYYAKYKNHLNKLHRCKLQYYNQSIRTFGQDDRKSPFVDHFHEIWDSDSLLRQEYQKFISEELAPYFPNESKLIIQKTPNIRFHLPGCSNIGRRESDLTEEHIGVHCDEEFGHPKEELNIILGLTEMFGSNSIYYALNGEEDLDEFQNLKMHIGEVFIGKLNTAQHYNKINRTDSTRVSLDFRIIPFSKFKNAEPLKSNQKFKIGKYYTSINI